MEGMVLFELNNDWDDVLRAELAQPYIAALHAFLQEECARATVYPAPDDWLRALQMTSYRATKVVILGQDPYHKAGQAHGLSFSVPRGVALPPSLRNIYQELQDDLHAAPPPDGDLSHWAEQGVLLLNTVLTVREQQPLAHRDQGWEQLTDAVIQKLNERPQPLVFVLWGKPAQDKKRWIDTTRHAVIESVHPSPLSAYRGFFGSRPFSRTNEALIGFGLEPIRWT
jgi:uracil-DNA glycosylase